MSAISAIELLEERAPRATVVPPPLPGGRQVRLTAVDDPEFVPETTVRDVVGCAFGLVYVDAKDDESERRITVRHLSRQGRELYVGAYCHERQAPRLFRVDRMVTLIDLQTGEVIDRPQAWIEELLAADPTADALMRARYGINVLAAMARCDGRFHADERDIIVDYVKATAEYDRRISEERARQYVAKVWPDERCFQRSAKSFRKSPDEVRPLLRYVRKVVDCDGRLTDEEFSFAQRLNELLRA